ncbi:NAD-dependent epimerase/dehydratase family protein [Halonotius terrestris]|uniref:NAD-dependent epimerase/dehydratase family protein n=1 Tax=Halonotius terrestris TaxID=2487750 RepID=A0A8J8TBT4_9EURY|nr:NAD-dependent epimerase/dehydratase family protein [Halonotius terrestris]TQQ79347.1 NAD-dependent epimerase/dehydratase family protein [Halonotius terrestris]
MDGQRVLVTGGSGFIGGALVDSLREEAAVRILDTNPGANPPDDVEVIEGDVRDPATVEAAVEGVDTVFHEAALISIDDSIADPLESHAVNTTGTLQVLEAARKHDARVVLASSAAVYGDPNSVPVAETARLNPTSPYGLNKLAVDHYARLYHELYGLETVALRYFNVYGPGQTGGDYAGVIDIFREQARSGEPITVHGDGEQTRDFVHIDDIVRANRLAAKTENVGTAYNVGTGESVTITELAERIKRSVGSDSSIVHTDAREGDIRHSRADVSRARAALDYEAEVGLDEGLDTLVEAASPPTN